MKKVLAIIFVLLGGVYLAACSDGKKAELEEKPIGTITWLYKKAMDKLRKELEYER